MAYGSGPAILSPVVFIFKSEYSNFQLILILEPQTIVTSPGYGFTNVDWVDMDLDGHADAIAIRTRPTGSELIWMQQPPHNAKWTISTIDKDVGGNQFKTMWIKVKGPFIINFGGRRFIWATTRLI